MQTGSWLPMLYRNLLQQSSGQERQTQSVPKNTGNQILSYTAPYLTRQNCSVLTAPTSDCPPKELVIRLKEREE
jgi:hypothetical protein